MAKGWLHCKYENNNREEKKKKLRIHGGKFVVGNIVVASAQSHRYIIVGEQRAHKVLMPN